jgi:hypothetical protein
LRYYEKRELERQEAERQRLLHPELQVTTSWRERAEKFALFGATVVLGLGVSKYVVPLVTEYLGTSGWTERSEL